MGRSIRRIAFAGILLGVVLPAYAGADTAKLRYALRERSTYQSGCFEPCACPIMEPVPLTGGFALDAVGFDGPLERFLVTDLILEVPLLGRRFTGTGSYTFGGGVQSLQLELQDQNGTVHLFDSGLVPADDPFPAITIEIDYNDRYCFDEPMLLRADPVDPAPLHLAVLPHALTWPTIVDATGYDVVEGSLTTLRTSGGDFTLAATTCLAHSMPEPGLPLTTEPLPGEALWFLVRAPGSALADTWDAEGTSQPSSRDPGIRVCP